MNAHPSIHILNYAFLTNFLFLLFVTFVQLISSRNCPNRFTEHSQIFTSIPIFLLCPSMAFCSSPSPSSSSSSSFSYGVPFFFLCFLYGQKKNLLGSIEIECVQILMFHFHVVFYHNALNTVHLSINCPFNNQFAFTKTTQNIIFTGIFTKINPVACFENGHCWCVVHRIWRPF